MLGVFWRFLLLGLTSFGGPAAHLGYFRTAFVERLGWLDDAAFARILALSQFLPGPASSQVGFAIGLRRAGLAGGVAAFVGFTAPSFVLLVLLSVAGSQLSDHPGFLGVVHGLKLLAVVVVADATWTMAGRFCRTRTTAALGVLTAAALLAAPGLRAQFGALAIAALVGAAAGLGGAGGGADGASRDGKARAAPLVLFAVLFVGLPLAASLAPEVRRFGD
ncbi:MAG: chromate transporter, partial [Planctomycetota bacterium JB042]